MTTHAYTYQVLDVERVSDGDTYWLHLDIGFRQTFLAEIRLDGYDAAELRHGSEFERSVGAEAKQAAEEWLRGPRPAGSSLWVRTKKDPDKYGRWLGDVWLEADGDQWPERHLGAELHSRGLASVWPTRWHEEYEKK